MKLISWCMAFALACGCSRDQDSYAADNTGRNIRDKNGDTLTPTDQSESEPDRKLTQEVRQALMDDSSLSVNAKNIKVISQDGKVTLRGVVSSEGERNNIVAKVSALVGVHECDDQLEVKAN